MALANEGPAAQWRNVAVWSAVGAVFYILVMWGGALFVNGKGLGAIAAAILGSGRTAAMLGLGLVLSMGVFGFTYRKRRFGARTLRNFVIHNGVAVGAFLLAVQGFGALVRTGAMTPSIWTAAVTGATIIVVATLGSLAVGIAHGRADLIDDEAAAEEMLERSRLLLYSFAWMIAWGLMLIVLALGGPADLLSPTAALAGALALIAVAAALGVAVWRIMDELDRTLSHESGNMACYLILAVGGGWAMLAHLGFVAAAAPLDWLTLLTVLMFAASFIVLGRRKLLSR